MTGGQNGRGGRHTVFNQRALFLSVHKVGRGQVIITLHHMPHDVTTTNSIRVF